MFQFSHSVLIVFSGALWMAVGLYLLPLGIHFLLASASYGGDGFYLIQALGGIGATPQQAAVVLLAMGLALGYLKNRAILSKTVRKGVQRILTLPPKAPLYAVFTPKYLVLIAIMMLLGLSLKWMNVPFDIRGLVDVAIGSALINGSMLYFRSCDGRQNPV